MKKDAKNVKNSVHPITIIFLCSLLLLKPDIALNVIEKGKIPIARISNTVSPVTYWAPIIERMNLGATTKAEIIGAVKLSAILIPVDDKSLPVLEEAGITINAMLEAKLPAITLTISEI